MNPRLDNLRLRFKSLASRDTDAPATDHHGNGQAVVDTVGYTAQIPDTKAGSPRPPDNTPASSSASEAATDCTKVGYEVEVVNDGAAPVDDGTAVGVPAVDDGTGLGASTSADSAVELAHRPTVANVNSATAPTAESTRSMVTTELVSGLRTASRHLSRPSAYEGHLRTELTIAARRIDSLVRSTNAQDHGWAIAAMALIHDAGCALEQRRITDGWQLLRAAQAEMLDGLDSRSLAVERANVTGTDLVVVDDTDVDIDRLRSEVWAMRHTKNTYHAELDRRLFEAARGLFHRAVTLLGVLALGAVGVLIAAPSAADGDALDSIAAYLTIVGLGATGAAVSHVLFTNNSTRASAISEVANPLQIVLLRLTFGGLAGLLVVVLLQADIQNMINVTAISAYPWAILGGFAERFVDRVIDHVEADAHVAAAEACREGIS